jgi:hypothetical protein
LGYKLSTNVFRIENDYLVLEISCKHGIFNVLLDKEDYNKVKVKKWNVMQHTSDKSRYVIRHSYFNENKYRSLYIHRYVLDYNDKLVIDHINGNTLDNRKSNLRICTHMENCRNQKICKINTSNAKGVCFNRRSKKWTARIGLNNKRIFLGYFESKKDATIAYNTKAIEIYGKFAKLNEVENV